MKEGKMTLIVVLLVLGLVIVSGLYATTSGTTEMYDETITVSESAEKEVMPDEGQVYIEIETRAETAQETKNQNAQINENVLNALIDYGIASEDIETTSYYLNEETKWDRETEEYIMTGYVLTNIIKVTTSDIENTGEIIDTAVNAGATGVNNVQFTLSQARESELKAELLADAAQKAKTKAEVLVNAVGAELGELKTMSESSYYNPMPWYAKSAVMDMAVSAESYDTSISPEQLTVSATVTLTYEIDQ
ncbi:MAG: SIMPL domain-containing protein [Candidatus Woesearchaeota archaeon]